MSSQTGGDDDLLLERQLCFALAVASRTVTRAYRPALQDLNLTHPQYLVMLALWQKSPRSVKDIGDALLLSAATLSPLLKRLEAGGYVTRRRTEGDERTLAVGLTEQGASLREAAKVDPGHHDATAIAHPERGCRAARGHDASDRGRAGPNVR